MSSDTQSSRLHGSYAWTNTLRGIYYGPGSISTALPELLANIGGTKALIVTGKSLFNKTDVVKTVEAVLRSKDAYGATFYDIGEHSPIAGIRAGVKAFKDAGADIIVSVGGGSPVDASKAILYYLQQESGGPYLKQIAVPTTLSAAEYTVGAGYTNDEGTKVSVSSPELAPAGIILDAELTLPTPERLWLSTGIRSLDHAVENLYRPYITPPQKALCYQALHDLFEYLPKSKANPQDVAVRQKLQLASWMSLFPMKIDKYAPLGLSHSLGHRLGASYSIPHGITSCLTLAPVVRLKAKVASQEDKEDLAAALFYLGQPSTGSIEGDALKLADLIEELVANLGLKSTLTQYNVPPSDIPKIAELALRGETNLQGDVVKILEGLY
ncbi:alcohol dehydrogenase IV [Artomyces pyxidatus]|uniref:Alcohol dehydrogenase IV n=1 Tax=Artomyces pyxidatus TaxID=48021 RepID=A0ACB8T4B4_9AGAM|nr:alcohol dehydrogenase IV [Artomyces pyxidatus]